MKKSTPILLSTGRLCLSAAVLLILSLACVLPAVPAPTQDINDLGTAIMGTMSSSATQSAVAISPSPTPVVIVETPTLPPATATPTALLLPTLSPLETATPLVISTATTSNLLISVSVATNCRVGPGRAYDRVGALQVGETAEVVGRNAANNYWYIRNPRDGGFCWLWGEYATLTGDFTALPVFTPPPSPTPIPAIEVTYKGLDFCTGWWVEFEVANTGGISFESLSITVGDVNTEVTLSTFSDKFTDLNGCLDSSSSDSLPSGARRTVSAPSFTYDPRGHQLRAILTLCSRDGLNGMCVSKEITFKP